MKMTTDSSLVDSIVSVVIAELEVVNLEYALLEVKSDFNLFQTSILNFILSAESRLDDAEIFQIAVGISALDYTQISIGGLAEIFES